jgi:hypothetical protein
MIYFTTLIFTLLLSHIARAVPACGDVVSTQDMYDAHDDEQILATYKVTSDPIYDNPTASTLKVACSNGPNGLASEYLQFLNFPNFPFLGGAFDAKWGSENCGKCWKLTNTKTGRSIYFTAINAASQEGGFNIGTYAYSILNDHGSGSGTLDAEAVPVSHYPCRFR